MDDEPVPRSPPAGERDAVTHGQPDRLDPVVPMRLKLSTVD
jgi:hypothetical protein